MTTKQQFRVSCGAGGTHRRRHPGRRVGQPTGGTAPVRAIARLEGSSLDLAEPYGVPRTIELARQSIGTRPGHLAVLVINAAGQVYQLHFR